MNPLSTIWLRSWPFTPVFVKPWSIYGCRGHTRHSGRPLTVRLRQGIIRKVYNFTENTLVSEDIRVRDANTLFVSVFPPERFEIIKIPAPQPTARWKRSEGQIPRRTLHCALCTVHCALCTVHCALYTVHCELSTVHCELCIVHCTVHCLLCINHSTVHCELCTVHCTVHCLLCTMQYTVHCTLHCALYIVHCIVYCTFYPTFKCWDFNVHSGLNRAVLSVSSSFSIITTQCTTR